MCCKRCKGTSYVSNMSEDWGQGNIAQQGTEPHAFVPDMMLLPTAVAHVAVWPSEVPGASVPGQHAASLTRCYLLDQASFTGKKVDDGIIHGCSASPGIPTQTLSFLGWNRMPELLWDVVSSWGLWNSWFSADRDRHWSPIIPSERNLCRTTPAWSSRLDSWAPWRRSRWSRGLSMFSAAQNLEAVKATELPGVLSGLLWANKRPWAAVGAGKTRIHQRRTAGAAAATPESSDSARSAALCVSQETEDRWGSESDVWVSVLLLHGWQSCRRLQFPQRDSSAVMEPKTWSRCAPLECNMAAGTLKYHFHPSHRTWEQVSFMLFNIPDQTSFSYEFILLLGMWCGPSLCKLTCTVQWSGPHCRVTTGGIMTSI